MNLLSNILIQPNVITQSGLDFLIDYINKNEKIDLGVFDANKSNLTKKMEYSVDKKIRDTQGINIQGIVSEMMDLYQKLVTNIINPFYNVEILDSEMPQLLRYIPGGFYSPHVDGESLCLDENKNKVWKKTSDRDISTIIYLNDDFEGGELVFPELKIMIKPEPGLLVCFPSTHEYVHAVNPITKGERFAIVNWLTIKGYPRLPDYKK